MPKYYCDYCDTFLTHDSPSVRKTHNGGRKHKENVRMYYQGWMEEQAQKLVDATARAFTQQKLLTQGGAPPGAMGARPPLGAVPGMMPGMRGPMPGMPLAGIPMPGMPMRAPLMGVPMSMNAAGMPRIPMPRGPMPQ